MTEREAYVAFNLLPEVGAVTVSRLVAAHGSAVAAWEALPDKLDWEGKQPQWEREFEQAAKMNVKLVTLMDAAYPPALKTIASPPLVLYVVGNPAVLAQNGVALVGTRRATLYGRDTAQKFAIGLAHAKWAVFSGLALGIDAAAHKGTLMAKGLTAGILGGALDKFYPQENAKLAREIVAAGGAVVSEFPFGRSPDMQTFPQRNRIVAGLSAGVVAVEAPLKSGTLITCHLALDQGRAVMAVPGRIDCPSAYGCLKLLRDGATLVTSAEDILEAVTPLGQLGRLPRTPQTPVRAPALQSATPVPPKKPAFTAVPEATITLEESIVLRSLESTGRAIDEIARETKLPVSKVNTLLVQLRVKRKAKFLPGNRVCRV